MKYFPRLSFLTAPLLLIILGACATSSLTMREEVAMRLASPAWMNKREIPASPFVLTAYERMHERFAPANVYIEGDGLAWLTKKQKSLNPTPKNPVGLHLATKDKADNVVYLARPCQYSGTLAPDQPCDDAYWSSKRFAPEVLAAYNVALDEIKARYDIESYNLIGFSGGGTLAALLAAQRDDVETLRTVAGNLDHVAHSDFHNVSYLEGSLNPVDFAEELRQIPQHHFIGGQDDIVPPAVLHSYLEAVEPTTCAKYTFIQEAAHETGWVEKWSELLSQTPACEQVWPDETTDYIGLDVPEPVFTPRETPSKP